MAAARIWRHSALHEVDSQRVHTVPTNPAGGRILSGGLTGWSSASRGRVPIHRLPPGGPVKTSWIDRLLSVTLTLAAVTLAVVAVIRLRTRTDPEGAIGSSIEIAGERVGDWRDLLPHSIFIGGDSLASVTIIEFADLECPVCRAFQRTMDSLVLDRGDEFQFRYISYPLAQHRFALPAARGLECSDSVGLAREWVATVYRYQDSLGLKPWGELAAEAGIVDTARISSCATESVAFERIERGRRIADQVRIRGTPTVLINGWKFTGALSRAALDSAITALSTR